MREEKLLSKVLQTGNMARLLERRVGRNMFTSRITEFNTIMHHYTQYGEMINRETLQELHPNFVFYDDVPEPLDFYIDEVIDQRKYNLITGALTGASRVIGDSTDEAIARIQNGLQTLYSELGSLNDTSWTDRTEERYEEFVRRASMFGLLGIATPWNLLDQIILGYQDGHFVTLAARPGKGKSWFLVLSAVKAVTDGKKVLFVTMEMSPQEIESRADAYMGRFGYTAFRSATMGQPQVDEYHRVLSEDIATLDGKLFITGDSDSSTGQVGVTFIESKIRQYDPDLVLIDGAYLLWDDQGGRSKTEMLYNFTNSIKRVAKLVHKPIVVTTQMTREKRQKEKEAGAGGVAWADSFLQDSDILMELFQDKDMLNDNIVEIIVQKQREGKLGKVSLTWNLETMDFRERTSEGDNSVGDGPTEEDTSFTMGDAGAFE